MKATEWMIGVIRREGDLYKATPELILENPPIITFRFIHGSSGGITLT
jgi:hypothetical protein